MLLKITDINYTSMNISLFWSLDTRMNFYSDAEYIVKLYKASMLRAKNLGYEINFYGDSTAISLFKNEIDTFYDISDYQFNVVDELKLYIHSQHDLSCVTIDGDLILKEPLKFPEAENTHVYFEFPETKNDILQEKNNIFNGYGDLKRIFRKYNVKQEFKHFNYDNFFACNTGLIKFNNQTTKQLFISEFHKIKEFFNNNIKPVEELNSSNSFALKQIRFIIAQYYFGCLAESLNIPILFLNNHNSYDHFYGNKKFRLTTKDLVNNILTDNEKM